MSAFEPDVDETPLERVLIGNDEIVTVPLIASFHNITHVVSIMKPPSERVWPGVKYLRIAIKDEPEVKILKPYHAASDWITHALRDPDARVLVHCEYGRSRSASLVIYHIMRLTHASFDTAFKMLKIFRPCVHPNAGFAAQLRGWGASFGRRCDWFTPVAGPPPAALFVWLDSRFVPLVRAYLADDTRPGSAALAPHAPILDAIAKMPKWAPTRIC